MKTTIEFNDELLSQIERLKSRDGVSMKALVEEGLRMAIAVREQHAGYRFEPVVVGARSPLQVVDVNALVAAANSEWPLVFGPESIGTEGAAHSAGSR